MKTRSGKAFGIAVLMAAVWSLAACSFPFPRAKSPPRAPTASARPVAAQPAPRATASATVRATPAPAPASRITKAALAAPSPADKAAELGSVYVVRKGDTVYGLSRRFGVPVRQIAAHNGFGPPYALSIGQQLSIPAPRQHRVTRKQTVYGISRLYRVPVRSLIDRNGLVPPYGLRIGQKLAIPELRVHDVAKGDTIYSISRRYEVERTELVRLNVIAPPYTIKPGQRLALPNARQSAPPARPAEEKLRVAAPANPAPRAIPKPPPRAGSKFLWPVQGKVVLGFGPKSNGLHNDGINIKAPRGAPVKAAENGVVAYAGNELRGFGNLLLIKHAGGWVTAYAHTEKVLVRRGDKVRRGQTIGRVGSTGNVASPQLHFEVRKGTRAVNPTRMLGPQTARLAN
jgi:murein DD-endopeptidase MepM/ murein hydrolase activator NlpD